MGEPVTACEPPLKAMAAAKGAAERVKHAGELNYVLLLALEKPPEELEPSKRRRTEARTDAQRQELRELKLKLDEHDKHIKSYLAARQTWETSASGVFGAVAIGVGLADPPTP